VGYAYALKLRAKRRGGATGAPPARPVPPVVVSFFGEGAVEEGVFTESVNFAALKELPLIFVCENNGYAIHTHQRQRQRRENICERVSAVGVPAERIEGNDLFRIYERVKAVVCALREGSPGPYFFECMTYRFREHVGPNEDFDLGYRTRDEALPWMQNDRVQQLAAMLGPEARSSIESEVEEEIRAAFAFAEESPFPQPGELLAHVFGGL
jgi:TPP-dependent pyruvate/acetoin dehydrogenase alpha subunit